MPAGSSRESVSSFSTPAKRLTPGLFVDIEGDKYLCTIVQITPPPGGEPPFIPHARATDLTLENDQLVEMDDPAKYTYHVRLVEEGDNPHGVILEVTPDRISRERLTFTRTLLKRFIRDCVVRDAAVYSPWIVKPPVAERYGIPSEMTDEIRQRNALYRERQMDKRKREREERLGLFHGTSEQDLEEEEESKQPAKKKAKKDKDDDKKKDDEDAARKKAIKYPIDDLLIEYAEERDGPHGRIPVRPTPNKQLPFGEHFERFLMSWSFLNVMGKPISLSPFSLDEYEQALYYDDQWSTTPSALLKEIHAALINALITDLAAGHEPVRPLALTGRMDENDTDYWEGKKGATAETLRPVVEPLGESWFNKYLITHNDRKGWESALVGCLWDRATLDTLPNYLDNILHLTFEDKPAPTRPTWSTGPAQASGSGLVPAKPEKRYSSLHHSHKLAIIAFLIELVQQTAAVRDFMEESTQQLTEVRKVQLDVKRHWRTLRAEIDALAPKAEEGENENGEGGEAGDGVKAEREGSTVASVNGNGAGTASASANGLNGASSRMDFSSPAPTGDEAGTEAGDEDSKMDIEGDEEGPQTAVARRRALKERAIEREAEEAQRVQRVAEEKAKRAEDEEKASERKRLQDEYDGVSAKLRQLDFDFRAHIWTLRARPLGLDRFGNRIWWFDGLGSAPLVNEQGKIILGTGRIYIQGVDDFEAQMLRQNAQAANAELHVLDPSTSLTEEWVDAKRAKEEGEGKLAKGEWAAIETPEQLEAFMSWLNPRGQRDANLAKNLNAWLAEIEAAMHRRLISAGLEEAPEVDEPVKKARPSRKVAGGVSAAVDDESSGHLTWKVGSIFPFGFEA